MNRPSEPVCDLTDLPESSCACPEHHHGETTVVSIAALERLAGRPLPAYRFRGRPRWRVPTPEATSCDHQRNGLCKPCDQLLDGLLADLPHLVEELGFTARKDTRFPDRGYRRGDVEYPDEATLGWHPAATNLLADLRAFTAGRASVKHDDDWTWEVFNIHDRRALLQHLSRLTARAHKIIDRPRDRAWTMCPKCRADVELKQRGDNVLCPNPECDYTAAWTTHQTDLLDASGDVMLTIPELVQVLAEHGETITQRRIHHFVEYWGLPRETIARPRWKDGRIETKEVDVYRVRDVRELQARLAKKP